MKGIILIITIHLFISTIHVLAQEGPVKVHAGYKGDLLNNSGGGIRSGTNYLGMATLTISFNTQIADLWNGGHFFLNVVNTHGATPASNLTGDFQGISNIEAGNLNYLHELWIKQTFNDLFIVAGLQDLSTEFALSEYGSLFINSSFGVHSTLADNIPSPLFPLTSLGILFNADLSNEISIKTAAYDGLPDDFDSNPHNLKWDINSRDGILTISEISFNTDMIDYAGSYKIGTYYHNHMTANNESTEFINNYGFYFVADQLIYKGPDENKLGIFAQIGMSPVTRNLNHFYFGTGINYTGFLERSGDVIGLAIAHAGLRNRSNETVIEFSYSLQLTEYFSIQPDIQYIINPSGTDTVLPSTLTGILRIGFGL